MRELISDTDTENLVPRESGSHQPSQHNDLQKVIWWEKKDKVRRKKRKDLTGRGGGQNQNLDYERKQS